MPDPLLAVKKVLDEDYSISKRFLRNANSELDSTLIFGAPEKIVKSINQIIANLFRTRKGLRGLYQTGIVFSGENRKILGRLYVTLRKTVEVTITELKNISDLKGLKLKADIIKTAIRSLEIDISSFLNVVSAALRKIKEKMRYFRFHESQFISTMPMKDEYLVPFFHVISETTESLEIMSPHIDPIHLRFLTYLKDCHSQPILNLKLLLNREEPAKNFLKSKDLPWFEGKVNYNLHGRLIISDKKMAIVSSADLRDATYLGHYESGVLTSNTELVSSCSAFFKHAWNQGIELAICDHPLENSRIILKHDFSKTKSLEGICLELYWALQKIDPSYRFRKVTESWGYIDSNLSSLELDKNLKEFPEFEHISFFSPILAILPCDKSNLDKSTSNICEILNGIIKPGMVIDIRFYDLRKNRAISDTVFQKTKGYLAIQYGCSFDDMSSNRVLIFLHKNKYIVTFTECSKAPPL